MSLSPKLLSLLIMYGSSSHLRSARENARKYGGISHCLIISSTLKENCLQYAGVPFIDIINENTLSLATHISIVPLKIFLIFPVACVPGLILWIAKFIDGRSW